jgi:NAD(P)-dependent dehydrogenase (short-subunit alcohol dehydrogenase family)
MSGTNGRSPGVVLITGAGSGIGRAAALSLAGRGYSVFAGLHRQPADLPRDDPATLATVVLEVTDSSSIASAREQIEGAVGAGGLTALVNCAGIALGGPLEFLPPDALRRQLDVNVVGQLAVTQAFLPLLRSGHGRIINVGSISGRAALPYLGPYAASKFALRALNDSLRVELRAWNIPVILVEPGSIATGIWAKGAAEAQRQYASWPGQARDLYGRQLDKLLARIASLSQGGIPAERAAGVIVEAVTTARPRARYVVAPASRVWLIRFLAVAPTWLRDRLVSRALR